MSKALVDKHLKRFEFGQRSILQNLREIISGELPTATEVIKYGIPTFLIHDVAIIGFDGFKNHNSIFPYSGSTKSLLKTELARYVQKIIKARISQINSSYPKKNGEFLEFYGNGVLKSSGKMKNNDLHGDWQWFRKDGVIMRSGSFKSGKQVGVWITYDQKGKPYKKTNFGS